MITSQGSNYKFTDLQEDQLSVFKGRIDSLKKEIKEGEEKIESLKKDSEKLQKEKNYFEDCNKQLKAEKTTAEKQKAELAKDIKNLSQKIFEGEKTFSSVKNQHDKKEEELHVREDEVKKSEKKLSERAGKLAEQKSAIDKDTEFISLARKELLVVAEKIKWSN